MPLFGHKNDNVVGTGNSPNLLRKSNHLQGAGVDGTTHVGHHGHTGPGPAIGAAAGGAAGHHEGHTATGALLGGVAGHHHAKNHPDGVYNPAGVNAPGATTNVNAAGTGMDHGGTAKEKELIGKIEHAAGTILCSSTLKAKGIEKEQEGKAQGAHIGAAQNLEQEAYRHRQHANALDGNATRGAGTGVTGGGNMAGVGAGGVHNATHPVGTGVHGGVPPAQDTYGTASGYPAGAPNDAYARGMPNAGVAGAGNQGLR